MDPWGQVGRLSKSEILSLQNDKLRLFINHYLYPFSPHYRRLFNEHKINPKDIQSASDLARIPFTSKLDFVDQEGQSAKYKDFILQPDEHKIKSNWPASKLIPLAFTKMTKGKAHVQDQLGWEFRPVFMTFTTGTTNRPVPFMYSNYDMENLRISGSRMLNLFDIKPDEKIVNIFPFAPHLAFWQVVMGGFASSVLIFSTGGGKVMGTDANIAGILKMQPSVILGVPSYIYHLMRVAKDQGHQMPFVKKIVLGASRVTTEFKLKLAELLMSMGAQNVSVFGTYGFTESRAAWAECPTSLDISSGYHLYPDKEIFEVIDPKTGEPKQEGEDGELVYTSLDARASTVLRYRTGDFVRGGITYAPCPHCGRTVPRISSDITRLSDVKDLKLSKVKGALVNMSNFAALFSEIKGCDEWQIEIRKKNDDPFEMDEMIVYVSPSPGSDPGKLCDEVRKRMVVSTEVTPNEVVTLPLEDLVKRLELETANKEKRIIDRRPKE